jgi:Uma2 family endonuclease
MDWAGVISNPLLHNLPFKIELNKWGQILMSPASNSHGHIQFEIGARIKDGQKGRGKVIMECSIKTSQGVKVADVAWASDEFFARHGYETPYKHAPEICVEIISPSNSMSEMEEKIELYLAKGAKEVWLVTEDGGIEYFNCEGKMQTSLECSC